MRYIKFTTSETLPGGCPVEFWLNREDYAIVSTAKMRLVTFRVGWNNRLTHRSIIGSASFYDIGWFWDGRAFGVSARGNYSSHFLSPELQREFHNAIINHLNGDT